MSISNTRRPTNQLHNLSPGRTFYLGGSIGAPDNDIVGVGVPPETDMFCRMDDAIEIVEHVI
jgi:hypothetical protein